MSNGISIIAGNNGATVSIVGLGGSGGGTSYPDITDLSGNIGIGQLYPQYTLDVNGTGNFNSILSTGLSISYISGNDGYIGLINNNGDISLDWVNWRLWDNNEIISVSWADRTLFDLGSNASLLWEGRALIDSNVITSANWDSRYLYDTDVVISADWNNRILSGNWTIQSLNISGQIPVTQNQTGSFINNNETGQFLTQSNVIITGNLNLHSILNSGTTTLGSNPFYSFTGNINIIWSFPSINTCTGRMYFIKNRGSAVLTLSGNGTDMLYSNNANNTFSINSGEAYIIINDGQYWSIN